MTAGVFAYDPMIAFVRTLIQTVFSVRKYQVAIIALSTIKEYKFNS